MFNALFCKSLLIPRLRSASLVSYIRLAPDFFCGTNKVTASRDRWSLPYFDCQFAVLLWSPPVQLTTSFESYNWTSQKGKPSRACRGCPLQTPFFIHKCSCKFLNKQHSPRDMPMILAISHSFSLCLH